MLKNLARLEHKIGDRVFHFFCDNDSPVNEAKEAMFQFLKYLGSIEDAAKAHEEQKDKESKVEEIPQEVKVE